MSTVEERIVQMKFENAAFQQGVLQTLSSLEKLNKGLQLQGAQKGLEAVSTMAQQFDQHMVRSRNSLGQFTTGIQQSTTVTQSFAQRMEASKESLGKVATGFSEVATQAQGFGHKIAQSFVAGQDALGRFTDNLNKTAPAADKAASSLKNIDANTSSLASKFSTLAQVATGALHSIGARAAEAGTRLLNSFSFAPIMDGFREYETNINSVQTILANTAVAGKTLKDVTATLDELNHYSDQTIYNFAEMAKNIGTFTAAGVGLKEATGSIKGIANLAAMAGANSEQASRVMYQLSQAISSGTVSLEDWNSVADAGMGNMAFKRALAETAIEMGTLDKSAVKLSGAMKTVTINGKGFEKSIAAIGGKEGWLTSDVLTNTLQQFTGDMTDAQLAAQGFSKEQIKSIQATAKVAKNAATEVKTMTQLFGTFKEQMGSGWAETWKIIFGDFNEAKGLFTGISNSVGKMLQNSSEARNKMLGDWDKLGGRKDLIAGVTNVFQGLMSVIKPIKDGFREIFPATTGKQLAEMTKNFREFTEKLKVGGATADKLKRTFAGVFAIFGIGFDIIKGVVGVIFDLVGQVTKGSGGFLNFTAKIGDFLVALRKGVVEGEGLTNFFKGLSSVLVIPIKLIQKLMGFLGSLFKDTDSSGVEKSVEGISSKLEPLGRLGEVVSKVWQKTLTVMKNVGAFFQGLGQTISESIGGIGGMFEGLNFDHLFAGLNTGLLAGLFLTIKNFAGGGAPGLLDGISDAIEGFTGTLKGMQNALNAATLLQIAIAVGILAVSLNILSKIDAAGLTRGSTAITFMFTQLLGSLAVFNKFIGAAGFAKLPFVMGSLILLASAVLILVQAVKQLSELDWNELAKGLTGLAVTLGLLVGALKFMPPSQGLISTGLGLIALAVAIKILASAVEDMSSLGWEELAKGLLGVGALLGALTLFTMFAKANKGAVLQGAGILLLAAGIKILASAVADMAELSWDEIARGLVTLAGALGIITGALMLIPPTAPLAAAGVLLTAVSLGMIADALADMAKMSWGDIGKSLTVMLGALTIIAAALYVIPPTAPLAAAGILITALALERIAKTLAGFAEYSWEEIGKAMTMLAGTMGIIAGAMLLMTSAIPGAAATLIIAAALAILAPVLMQFSQMSMGEIGTALLMLAGVFAVFGAASLLLAPVVPMMIALAAAIALLGIGLLAAGAGVLLFATGLTVLAAAGAAGTAAIIGIVAGLIALIPEVMKQIGLGLVAFAAVIATAGPAITKALVTVLNALIDAIVKVVPKVVVALYKLLTAILQTMNKYLPNLITGGMNLVAAILNGIAKNLGKVISAATNVIVSFIGGISKNLPKIIDSGVKLIISFINGVTKAIDSHATELGAAGGRLAVAIIKGMVKGLAGGLGEIKNAAVSVAKSALDGAKSFLGIHSPSKEFEKVGNYVNDGFKKGLDGNKAQVYDAFNDLKKMLLDLSKSSKASSSERKKAASAYTTLTKKLNDEKTAIGKLSDQYDKLTEKIKTAKDTYANAVKTRDDYKNSITDQYGDVATAGDETSVAQFKEDLKKQIEETKKYANTLQRLRALGLNDEMYKDLLAKGITGLPFADQLLAGGKASVDEVNKLGKDLDTVAGALGKNASTALYQAGVDAAAGLVKGLEGQQKKLEAMMDKLAATMVSSIKKKLGIKSPSVEFMKVGGFSAEGLIKGLGNMSGSVEKAAANTGTVAVESLRKSLSGFSDLITHDMDVHPVITPVLDLSGVKKEAGTLRGLLPTNAIAIDSAYSKASYIAAGYAQNKAAETSSVQPAEVRPIAFTQINNSPKALSTAEIYRQTNNQISKAKGALTTNADNR